MKEFHDARVAYEHIARAFAMLAELGERARQDGLNHKGRATRGSMDGRTREMFKRLATQRAEFDRVVQTILRESAKLDTLGLLEVIELTAWDYTDGLGIEWQDKLPSLGMLSVVRVNEVAKDAVYALHNESDEVRSV